MQLLIGKRKGDTRKGDKNSQNFKRMLGLNTERFELIAECKTFAKRMITLKSRTNYYARERKPVNATKGLAKTLKSTNFRRSTKPNQTNTKQSPTALNNQQTLAPSTYDTIGPSFRRLPVAGDFKIGAPWSKFIVKIRDYRFRMGLFILAHESTGDGVLTHVV